MYCYNQPTNWQTLSNSNSVWTRVLLYWCHSMISRITTGGSKWALLDSSASWLLKQPHWHCVSATRVSWLNLSSAPGVVWQRHPCPKTVCQPILVFSSLPLPTTTINQEAQTCSNRESRADLVFPSLTFSFLGRQLSILLRRGSRKL